MEPSVVIASLPFSVHCIHDGFKNTPGHSKTQDDNGIPHSSEKEEVTGIPGPFKAVWQHNTPLLLFFRVKFLFLGKHRQIPVGQGEQNNTIGNGQNSGGDLLPAGKIEGPGIKAEYGYGHHLQHHDPTVEADPENTQNNGQQQPF